MLSLLLLVGWVPWHHPNSIPSLSPRNFMHRVVATVVYPPCTHNDPFAQPVIPTSDNMVEQLKRMECSAFMAVLAFLEQVATSDEAIEVLKKMDCVAAGGGSLPCRLPAFMFGVPVATTSKQDAADGDWM
ncbi:hypothetical protein L210DRAFT_3561899 [Boletus edulis BED1]|uniref:Uncharacterized protein n=1 Tax=Boletus edulis BED1 TaxID=1328754 RepID=A0AAD4G8L6_BOLED|nr:hypothetical protein L210DRAFT_3561899 [Boletus edulis BED1]